MKFEQILMENLDIHCPQKSIKIGSQDKTWVNVDIKKLHRWKSREYVKRGNSAKNYSLQEKCDAKYNAAAEKYMHKNINALKDTNPGQAYSILKRMGAHPGDCTD